MLRLNHSPPLVLFLFFFLTHLSVPKKTFFFSWEVFPNDCFVTFCLFFQHTACLLLYFVWFGYFELGILWFQIDSYTSNMCVPRFSFYIWEIIYRHNSQTWRFCHLFVVEGNSLKTAQEAPFTEIYQTKNSFLKILRTKFV